MSTPSSNAETQLTIGRWVNTYIVPADHPCPEDFQHRLDGLVTRHLSEYCQDALAPVLLSDDPSVWRIRALKLDLPFVADARPDDRIARSTSERFATALAQVFSLGEDHDSVLRFPDRAAFLAQFLLDLAAGHAWSKWYYAEFDALSALPLGTTIAEVFVRESFHAGAVIRRLAWLRRIEEILPPLTDSEAKKIYDACFTSADSMALNVEPAMWAGRLLELWNAAPLRPTAAQETPHQDALRLFARAALQYPEMERDRAAQRALDMWLEIRGQVRALESPAEIEGFVQALATGNLPAALAIARRGESAHVLDLLRTFAGIMHGDVHWAGEAIGVLLKEDHQAAVARAIVAAPVASDFFVSSCIGIFLLGPSLVELKVGEIIGAISSEMDDPAAAAESLRYLLLVKCLGRARTDESWNDSALRLLSDFRGDNFLNSLPTLAPVDTTRAEALFIEQLVSAQRIDGRCLLAETVSLNDGEPDALLLSDPVHQEWITMRELVPDPQGMESVLIHCLDTVREIVGGPPEHLLLARRVAQLGDAAALSAHAQHLHAIDPNDPGGLEKIAALLQCPPATLSPGCQPKNPDFDYLSLWDVWPKHRLPVALDLATSLLARAVLKNFARRLIGFHSARQEHLYKNFLAGIGSVRVAPHRLEVQLPQSPLAIVLQLSGVGNQTYTVPWSNEKEVCLLPPIQ